MSHDITPVSDTHRHGVWNTEEYLEIFLGFVDTGDVPDTGVICDESSLTVTVLFCLVVGTDVSTFPVTALLDHTCK